jgi:SAM-dependent methyltransferase
VIIPETRYSIAIHDLCFNWVGVPWGVEWLAGARRQIVEGDDTAMFLLNVLARYLPALSFVRDQGCGDILEVGSGPVGIGVFLQQEFVGCDPHLDPTLLDKHLLPVRGDGTALPFGSGAFGTVISLDTLEHVHPRSRERAVRELLRVAKHYVILGFPNGRRAEQADALLCRWYVILGRQPPDWLTEHLAWPLPCAREIERVLRTQGFAYQTVGNENLLFHLPIMVLESIGAVRVALHLSIVKAERMWSMILPFFDAEPTYRSLFFVSKQTADSWVPFLASREPC